MVTLNPPPVEVVNVKGYRLALLWLLTLSTFYLIFGLSVVFLAHFIREAHRRSEDLLYLYTDYNQLPVYFITMSAILLSITGILGIVSTFYEVSIPLSAYTGLLFTVLAVNLLASATASAIPSRLIRAQFEAPFRGEVFHTLWIHQNGKRNDKQILIWDTLQKDIRCCGLLTPKDWYMTPLNAVPASCCNTAKYPKECKEYTGLDVKLGNNISHIRENIYPFLHKNCIQRIQDLSATRKVIWTGLPLAVILVEVYLFAFTKYTVVTIEEYASFAAREAERRNLGNPDLMKLKSRQKKYRVIPESQIASLNSIIVKQN